MYGICVEHFLSPPVCPSVVGDRRGEILLHYEGGRPTQQQRPSKKGTALVSQSLKNKLEYSTTPC